jgi:signal transduction histidine kinase/CheY-like chemotaxis protein
MEHACDETGEGRQVILGKGDDPRTYDVHLSPLLDWRGQLAGRVVVLRDITDHKRVEEGLRKAEREKALILESISEIVTYQDRDLRIVWTNQAVDRTTSPTANGPVGQHCYEAWQQRDRPCEECPVEKALNTGQPHGDRVVAPDQRTWSVRAYPVRGAGDEIVGAVEVALDITERENLERQFLQAQRMEAVGRLAGGVAHDFNNLLTAILGYTSLLLSESGLAESTRADLQEIQQAAHRAASLTRQLLAFGRKQILQPRTLDLNAVVSNLAKMIRRLVGEDIELITELDPALGSVRADPGQIEQLIMNLIVNARDAMPHGGKLVLKTANLELDKTCDHGQADIEPGSYVMLAVSDTGLGMDRETLSRVFEPFFTTKEGGKGTGLGLSTVYGIVRQHGGTIWPYSEPGQGSTFKICLPRVDQVVDPQEANAAFIELLRGTETILLAEDEDGVRALTRTALQRYGYTVLEARDGVEAISICQQHEGPVHLLLTDVVMPGMSGRELAESLSPFRPETKVLYMSGHTDDAIVRHGILDSSVPFLQKPFAVGVLIYKVREVLESRSEN